MNKSKLIFLILITPVILFSQVKNKKTRGSSVVKTTIPIQAQYSNKFKIKDVSFNKRIDYNGRGEVLEVEFSINNLTDDPMDLYVFVITTFEKNEKIKTSFNIPIPAKEKIRSFVPYPFDLKNFQYPDRDKSGNVKKNDQGKDRIKLVKFPRNPKAGINALTGKPYNLKDKIHVRTIHLSKYRTNFYFFNEAAILVFDRDGKPVFRQLYVLKGFRR